MTGLTFNDVNILPKYSDIDSRENCDVTTTICGKQYAIPLVPANMQSIVGTRMLDTMSSLGGIAILHRFNGWREQLLNSAEGNRYAISVGVNNTENELEILKEIETQPDFIVIDVAHGHHKKVANTIKTIQKITDIPIVAGNIATAEGARFLIGAGASGLKVGIGNGCFVPGTKIKTPEGNIPIQDIKVGDIVYTHKNTKEKVTTIFKRNCTENTLYEINGIKATPNHEFYVVNICDYKKITESNIEKYAFWVRADNLTKKHLLVELH